MLICLLSANLSFIACTDDSLAEIQEEIDTFADGDSGKGNGGDDGQLDPPDEPPAGN